MTKSELFPLLGLRQPVEPAGHPAYRWNELQNTQGSLDTFHIAVNKDKWKGNTVAVSFARSQSHIILLQAWDSITSNVNQQ